MCTRIVITEKSHSLYWHLVNNISQIHFPKSSYVNVNTYITLWSKTIHTLAFYLKYLKQISTNESNSNVIVRKLWVKNNILQLKLYTHKFVKIAVQIYFFVSIFRKNCKPLFYMEDYLISLKKWRNLYLQDCICNCMVIIIKSVIVFVQWIIIVLFLF